MTSAHASGPDNNRRVSFSDAASTMVKHMAVLVQIKSIEHHDNNIVKWFRFHFR